MLERHKREPSCLSRASELSVIYGSTKLIDYLTQESLTELVQ
jgi:hypothetical protein